MSLLPIALAANIIGRLADYGPSMRNIRRTSITLAMGLLLVGGAVDASPIAAAKTPKAHISATGGLGTAVNKSGTQGTINNSVQGVQDDDGDQDAFDLVASEKAVPQDKAENKMTK